MSAPSVGATTVVIVAREADTDGDWTTTSRTDVAGCSVQPEAASEDNTGREQAVARFRVWGPVELGAARSHHLLEVPGWVVGSTEPVVALGLTGPVLVWSDLDGVPHHAVAVASLVTG